MTTPKRGVGGATPEALGTYAGERHLAFAAAFEEGFAHRVQRASSAAARVLRVHQSHRISGAKEPVEQVMNDLFAAIGYEAWLNDEDDKRAALTRWNNVQEFVKWLARKGEMTART